MECTNEMQMKHSEQLTKLEMEIQSLKVSVANFDTIKETLLELRFSNAALVESNKDLKLSNEKITQTLETITAGFQGLHSHVNNIQEIANKNTAFREEQEAFIDHLAAEKIKSKYTLIGIIFVGVISLLNIIVPLLLSH